ncbi:hypothetical protein GOP47_0020653 [Adiantum capillus-veneris]|uniref:Uncharacterized protein n=1 Tax=Adiantum capillus-veneris TaxID=13818 RepID=A0A9D4Z6A3_ADICA|nr:hypothetical protein GOP47_0020653 [Adiantum capillus-veneris]
MVKDKETKDVLLHRTEVYGKVTCEKFGLESLFPLVSAGIFVHRNGEPEDVSDSEGHDHLPPTSSAKKVISEPSLSARVTFLVTKKVPLMHVVGLFKRLQQLGNNDPEKALHMACKYGLSWERIVEIPCDATFTFSFVVLKKTIGQKKWIVVKQDRLDAKLPPAAYGKTETSKVEPKVHKIDEHRRKYRRLQKERELIRRAAPIKAKANQEYEASNVGSLSTEL